MLNFEEEKAITIELSNEEPIQAEVQDINYIPAYKQAEEERRANEEERQKTYQELTKMIDEGKVTGIYVGEEEPTDEMVDVWIDPNGTPTVEAYNIIFADNETLQTKYENGELKGDKGDRGIDGVDGVDGYTPVRGTDYWTEEDIETIEGHCDNYISSKIGTVYEEYNNSVSCTANTTNPLVSLTLPAGTYIITSGFRYDGTNLRYFHGLGSSQNSSYDNAGSVADVIVYIGEVFEETTITPILWPDKDVTVVARTKAIKIK
jgi:hypothetical protein